MMLSAQQAVCGCHLESERKKMDFSKPRVSDGVYNTQQLIKLQGAVKVTDFFFKHAIQKSVK